MKQYFPDDPIKQEMLDELWHAYQYIDEHLTHDLISLHIRLIFFIERLLDLPIEQVLKGASE